MKKIVTLLIMAAVSAACFTGCEGTITSSGEINITGIGEKSSSVEESSSAEEEDEPDDTDFEEESEPDDDAASAGGSTSGELTLESLQQGNLLSNLFSQYDTVVYTEDYPRGFGAYTYIIETDTGYTLWHDYNMSGYYNEFFYSPHADEPDRMTAWPVEVMPEWLDDFVGDTLLPTEDDEIIPMESSSGETVFYIESSDYDDVNIVYTVDSETLVLKTIERINDSDESLSIITFHYGEEVELPETVTAWQGELRTITLNILDENVTEVYQIPANWEFAVDEYCPWSAAYLDEACTQPYEYPGNGTDYTIYVREEAE